MTLWEVYWGVIADSSKWCGIMMELEPSCTQNCLYLSMWMFRCLVELNSDWWFVFWVIKPLFLTMRYSKFDYFGDSYGNQFILWFILYYNDSCTGCMDMSCWTFILTTLHMFIMVKVKICKVKLKKESIKVYYNPIVITPVDLFKFTDTTFTFIFDFNFECHLTS